MNINIHTSHPSAFISSTFIDLKEERHAVAEALKERGLNVNALDVKPASNTSSKNEIIEGIRESDFIVLIIGDRYGSILPHMTGSESRSITWWEYNIACHSQKPVLAFFRSLGSYDSVNHDNLEDKKYKMKRTLFDRFRDEISKKHNPQYFEYPDELAEKVQGSLISVYRNGIKALTKSNVELKRKLEQQERNNSVAPPSRPSGNALLNLGAALGGTTDSSEEISKQLLAALYDSKKP